MSKHESERESDYEMPKGRVRVIKDYLPPPSELIYPPSKTVKITIEVNQSSVEFFKAQAMKHHTKYQKMIRELLDKYVSQHKYA